MHVDQGHKGFLCVEKWSYLSLEDWPPDPEPQRTFHIGLDH